MLLLILDATSTATVCASGRSLFVIGVGCDGIIRLVDSRCGWGRVVVHHSVLIRGHSRLVRCFDAHWDLQVGVEALDDTSGVYR